MPTKKKNSAGKQSSVSDIVAENTPPVNTFPSYTYDKTDDPTLFRVVDRQGDWTHYFQETAGYLPAVNHILRIGFPKGQGLLNWLKQMTPEEADQILKTAGERGSKVHAAIRDLIMGITVDVNSQYVNDDHQLEMLKGDEWDCLLGFQAWAEKFQPKLKVCEVAVWNKDHRYAGTIDFIGTIQLHKGDKVYINDKITTLQEDQEITALLDWKTSKAVHDDYRLQVAAYAACIRPLPEYTGIVRVGTAHKNGGYEMKLWTAEQTSFHFDRFLAAKDNYDWLEGGWEPSITNIPSKISVTIPLIQTPKRKKIAKKKEKIINHVTV